MTSRFSVTEGTVANEHAAGFYTNALTTPYEPVVAPSWRQSAPGTTSTRFPQRGEKVTRRS